MTYHALHHGGNVVRNPNQEMYPAAPLPATDHLQQAAHKTPCVFSNTRLFDFSLRDTRRQAGLQQYLERINAANTPLQSGDTIGACAIPAGSLLLGYAWGVENAAAGVAFTIKTHFAGATIDSFSAASIDSHCELLAAPVWMKDNEIIDLLITSWPAEVPKDLRFWVTPLLVVPKVGN
ncbi:hypothetical protein WK59_03805 [Burkholderia ubonensis]|uniref:hypothetical protein n=1 Tax=Burkholderia ubonensis TaxID=101571 RepID=UPI00075B8E18|nr:hypothetical protein [Burkholderia ubonensis]KVD35428.1 hypothetical protein WI84_16290 [Burkholderia ubonensis]KVT91871.1 hypothetical protein WK59_03805 [Burkholderia ubonensis]